MLSLCIKEYCGIFRSGLFGLPTDSINEVPRVLLTVEK